MNTSGLADVQQQLDMLRDRAERAERLARSAITERDYLRRVLTHSQTSLAEQFNDPAENRPPVLR